MNINDVAYAYEQPIKFVTGFAGSGKSTKLAKLASPTTLVMTPTHKAAEVLHRKGIIAYTIHSVLKLVPTINMEFRRGQRLQRLKKIGDTKLSAITDVFIDEFSMINVEILDMLLDVLPAHTKVTVFGDPYQLPPVDGTPIDPLDYTEDIVELTTQHRAEAPEVVETFMRFKDYIKDGSQKDLTISLPHGSLTTFNPKTDRALAYTNNKVLQMNSQIAYNLGLTEEIALGEEMLVNDMIATKASAAVERAAFPGTMSKGKLMAEPDFTKASYKLLQGIRKFNTDLSMYSKCSFSIDDVTYQCWYDCDHYNTSKKLKKAVEEAQFSLIDIHKLDKDTKLSDWCKENRVATGVMKRGKAWSRYLAHKNLVFNIRRPFATTIHKAQGQEFSRVFIAQRDIKLSIKNNYFETYAKLMYVALSRAIHSVVII